MNKDDMIERLQIKEISELYSIIKKNNNKNYRKSGCQINHDDNIETVRISFVAESGTQPLNQGK